MNISSLLGATMVAGAGPATQRPREGTERPVSAERRRVKVRRRSGAREDSRSTQPTVRSIAKVAR